MVHPIPKAWPVPISWKSPKPSHGHVRSGQDTISSHNSKFNETESGEQLVIEMSQSWWNHNSWGKKSVSVSCVQYNETYSIESQKPSFHLRIPALVRDWVCVGWWSFSGYESVTHCVGTCRWHAWNSFPSGFCSSTHWTEAYLGGNFCSARM